MDGASIKGIRLLTSAATNNTNPHPTLITPATNGGISRLGRSESLKHTDWFHYFFRVVRGSKELFQFRRAPISRAVTVVTFEDMIYEPPLLALNELSPRNPHEITRLRHQHHCRLQRHCYSHWHVGFTQRQQVYLNGNVRITSPECASKQRNA